MKTLPILCLAVALAVPASGGQQSVPSPEATKPQKAKRGPDVLVVSEVFEKSSEDLLPSADKPTYYYILGCKERNIGVPYAGEPMPKSEEVINHVVDTLAARGYVRTEAGGPFPPIILVITYGSAAPEIDEFDEVDDSSGSGGGQDPFEEPADPGAVSVFYNRREIYNIVGFAQASKHLMSNFDSDDLNAAADDDRLYILVAAFDTEKLAKRKKQLVWRTIMSMASRRQNLPDSLSLILASGAPYFGRETDRPEFVDDVDRMNAQVEMGELEVIGIEERDKPAETKKSR